MLIGHDNLSTYLQKFGIRKSGPSVATLRLRKSKVDKEVVNWDNR